MVIWRQKMAQALPCGSLICLHINLARNESRIQLGYFENICPCLTIMYARWICWAIFFRIPQPSPQMNNCHKPCCCDFTSPHEWTSHINKYGKGHHEYFFLFHWCIYQGYFTHTTASLDNGGRKPTTLVFRYIWSQRYC